MANKIRTIEKDLGYKKLLEQMEKMEGSPRVDVGYFSGGGKDTSKGPTSIAEYMFLNEVGTETIPARPVMAQTADKENAGKCGRLMMDGSDAIAKGKSTPNKVLTKIGIKFRGSLQKAIHAFSDPPNALSTQEQKGPGGTLVDNPLVDTGTAANAVTFEIRNK